jgi:hypothetical protein
MNVLECLGVCDCTVDKETDTDEIMFYSNLLFPEADGELKLDVKEIDVGASSSKSGSVPNKAMYSNSMPAKWLSLNSNRITSPDVRKGSKVVIYRWEGTDKYLWTYFGMDSTLRLETVIYAFSANPNTKVNDNFDPNNYYLFLINTRKGSIQLLTGQGNGEATNYAITLDTKNGSFSFVDGMENILAINSVDHSFTFLNEEKSSLSIKKDSFILTCENSGVINAKNNLNIKTKNLSIVADDSINIKTNTTTLVSEGGVNITGKTSIDGELNVTKTIFAEGIIKSEVDVQAGPVSLLSHVHTGVLAGGDKSGPPAT